ncbi:hypothetical protein LTR37_007554 [Vermiconidia calcicola]|uniref:Uncharacterized protein n=1 Tax=Vermiconidia calcicola TaxID=1690605 RepID=A0ACC3NDN7_9PEZI|nr:hypothetical protein LTR37_007554 [Vermiconidia calcicola]
MSEKDTYKQSDGLQVIGTGLPRTGTLSLYTALGILGITPCHHFKTVMDDGVPYRQSQRWQQACKTKDAKARREVIRQIYSDGGFKSGVDYPTSHFVEDLVELYPDAKFVHGIRSSPQQWRKSFNGTIGRVRSSAFYYSCFLFPQQRFSLQPLLSVLDTCNVRNFHATLYSSDDDVEIYHRHNAHVHQVVPASQLLEFDPKQGWAPLCEFLDVPIPTDEYGNESEYPHVNDTENLRRFLNTIMFHDFVNTSTLSGSGYEW